MIDSINLEAAIKRIFIHGPDRTMISAVEARRVAGQIRPDIIFIRNDGWSLGSPKAYEANAYALWTKEWVAFMRSEHSQPIDIKHYLQLPVGGWSADQDSAAPPVNRYWEGCPRCGSACEKRKVGRWDEPQWCCTACAWCEKGG